MKIKTIALISFLAFFSLPSVLFGASFTIDTLNLNEIRPDFVQAYLTPNKLHLEEVWNKMNDDTSLLLHPIKIGIIDNPIDITHPEFSGKLVGGNTIGKVNFGNTPIGALTPSVFFSSSVRHHGMAVASIIGANNISVGSSADYDFPHMNGILSGVSRLDYTLELRSPITQITTLFFDAGRIEELRRENVSIINLSRGSRSGGYFLKNKIVKNPDILFVVAAGNDGVDASTFRPANLGNELPNVITVGAVNNNDERAIFPFPGASSNFGNAVNISAPGVKVYMPALDGGYQIDSGTSYSAPLVTGTAGLLKSIKPSLTPAQIKQILVRSADPIITDQPIGGRLNALKSVCDPLVLDCATAGAFQLQTHSSFFGNNMRSRGDILANENVVFGTNLSHTGNIKGNQLFFGDNNRVEGDIAFNFLETTPTTVITGTRTASLSTPIVSDVILPPTPAGEEDAVLQSGETRTVSPGNYRDIGLEEGATIIFQDGVYNVENAILLHAATIRFSKNTVLNIGRFFIASPNTSVVSADGISILRLNGSMGESVNDIPSVFFSIDRDTRMEADIRTQGNVVFGDDVRYSGSVTALNVIAQNNFTWNVPETTILSPAAKTQTAPVSLVDQLRTFKKDMLALLKRRGIAKEHYSEIELVFNKAILKAEAIQRVFL